MKVWLPYASLAEAEARAGHHDGIEITVLDDADGLAQTAADVAYIALPNFTAMRVWKELQPFVLPALRVVQLGSAGYEGFPHSSGTASRSPTRPGSTTPVRPSWLSRWRWSTCAAWTRTPGFSRAIPGRPASAGRWPIGTC